MYVLPGFFGGNQEALAGWSIVEVMTASSFAHRDRTVGSASHHHPGKRRGGQTRWGTGLSGVVVGALGIAGLAWISGVLPGIGLGAPGTGTRGTTVTITATHAAGMRSVYPGESGDVAVSIVNHGNVAVRITGVVLPSNTTYAAGFANAAHTAARRGCSAASSQVIWNGATGARAMARTLAVPVILGAHQRATVTMANGAYMAPTAPAACEATSFVMPKLVGIEARADVHARRSAPAVDTWVRQPR